MTTSRSTPRLRLTAVLLLAVLALVAISERNIAVGLPGELMQLAGLACIACAVLGRIWSSVFVAGRKDTSLVRDGPYSALRHPLYALSLLGTLGVGLATRSIAITVALVAAFGWMYSRAAGEEDAYLAGAHGEAFAAYRREVPAFLPGRSRYQVPESLEIHPRVLWKAFLDAGSLLGYYVLLRIADHLQSTGVAPTWFTLP